MGTLGTDLDGNTLIVFRRGDGVVRAQWLGRDGHARTEEFTVPEVMLLTFLPEGGLAAFDGHAGRFTYTVADLATGPSPLPGWLEARARNLPYYVVKNGRAIASWGKDGQCEGRIEVVARSGKSCGCVAVPDLSTSTTIGRDGSLIVPHASPSRGCTYRLYPQLFQ